jgi:hypothetical protein
MTNCWPGSGNKELPQFIFHDPCMSGITKIHKLKEFTSGSDRLAQTEDRIHTRVRLAGLRDL